QGVDIAIRVGPLRNSNMTARKLATSNRLVVGSSDYFERVGIPRTPNELNLNDAITCTQDAYSDVWPFHRESQELVIKTSSRLRVGGCEGVRAAVLSGAGFAIASEWMFAPEFANSAVRTVLTDWTLPRSSIWAVFPAGRMSSGKARTFAAFVETQLHEL